MTTLRVKTGRLRELSATQQGAAGQIGTASAAAQGVGTSMALNHGVICAATTAGVMMAEQVRSTAAAGVQVVSTDLAQKLSTAASQYDATDQELAVKINQHTFPK